MKSGPGARKGAAGFVKPLKGKKKLLRFRALTCVVEPYDPRVLPILRCNL